MLTRTVCVFGDSVTKGVVFDSVRDKYTLLKDSFVNLAKSGGNFAISNYSRFGSTIAKGLEMLSRHKSELSRCDYTVLEFGGNDCDFDWAEVAAAPDAEHVPNTPVGRFEQLYTSMIAQIRTCGSRPVLLTLPPVDAKRYFAWISRGLNADAILHFLGDVEYIYRWHEMYNLAVCRLSKNLNVPLIDISSAFLQTPNYQQLICDDGIHPNERGHRLIGRTIGETIGRLQEAYA